MSLRKKLIIIFGVLIVAILTAFTITSYLSSQNAYISVLKKELTRIVDGMYNMTIYYDRISKSEENILELKKIFKGIKIGKEGYPYVLDSEGTLLIHPHIEGKNLMDVKDVNGFEFVKDIVKKKNGETWYYWPNAKNPKIVEEKIAVYSYYEPLDWYIVSSITVDEFMGPVKTIRNVLISMGLIFLIVSFVIVLLVGNSISVPVMKIASELKNATNQVSIASKDVAIASQKISQVTTEQASNIEETSSSLEEIAGMVNNNVESAEQSLTMSHRIVDSSQKGFESVEQLIGSMKEILDSNDNIQKLSEVIGEIADKTKVIDEIVFQTKLLSFNASVEAERAGEHGRGFAVVAQEVGNLAQMSGKAALEISSIVKDSVKKTEVITTTNKEKVERGNVLVKETSEILKDIKDKSLSMQDMSQAILKASKEQSTGVSQINQAVSELDKSIQDNAATAEETASAGEELTGQAQMMLDIVSRLSHLIEGSKLTISPNIEVKKKTIVKTSISKPDPIIPKKSEFIVKNAVKKEEAKNDDDEWTKL